METSLEKLVSELRKEKGPIVVSGPQRSGTTIATKILATELDRIPVYEEAFDTHNLKKFRMIAYATPNAVIQAPALMYHIVTGEWPYRTILMRRPIEDIIESAQRIGWEQYEDRDAVYTEMLFAGNGRTYNVLRWKREMVDELASKGTDILDYSALASHHLFVQKHKRANFKPRQIKV